MMIKKSPEFVRTSTAGAITLKLQRGRFYRNAKLGCINLLLEYPGGCQANCSYCGLSNSRPGSTKSFIRVAWPLYSLDQIIEQSAKYINKVSRICISMITKSEAVEDTILITQRLRQSVELPVSLLIAPTITNKQTLLKFKEAGADRIGIAVDAATEPLFRQHRGTAHQWQRYWSCFDEAVEIFGINMVGSHLMAGLGETENDMVDAIFKTRNHGGYTHLFSFFPEKGTSMENRKPPALDSYRRIQLARYLIDNSYMNSRSFEFDRKGQIVSLGLAHKDILDIIKTGKPFQTSGCPGQDGEVACNRPFGNSVPGPDVRNLPYKANKEDIERILDCMGITD